MADNTSLDPLREQARKEAENDLNKSVLDLVTDVHHETMQKRLQEENILHAQKRMISMMGKVAIESQNASNRLERLTWGLIILTVVIGVLTIVLVFRG